MSKKRIKTFLEPLKSLSISKKIISIIIIIIFIILFSTIFISRIFLPKIYINSKVKIFEEIYSQISSESEQNVYTNNFRALSEKNNCNIYLLKFNDDNSNLSLEYPYVIEKSIEQSVKKKAIDCYLDGFFNIDENTRKTYKFDGEEIKEKITETGNYRIYKTFDKAMNSYYLELLGLYNHDLNNNEKSVEIVYFRSNLNSMNESLSLFNNLLLIICITTGSIGVIVIHLSMISITKPLLKLSKITKDIANFQFDKAYKSNKTDEIGILTNSIYFLSTELEKKINEIKEKNIELKQDIKKKEEIDILRKEFISNISHELKTPLSIIQGYAEGLQDFISDNESRDFYCEVILDEVKKMNILVQKMLLLNKLEFGDTLIECHYFNLTEVLKSVLKSSQVLFEEKGIKLDLNLIENAKVYSDEFLIEDVITNYITNACNYCIKIDNKKLINIKIEETDNFFVFSIYNTGNQIPEESLDRIWEKFYKVDKARSRSYGGSGIGLSIVKTTMELLDGEYGVINEKEGVTFWFKLKK